MSSCRSGSVISRTASRADRPKMTTASDARRRAASHRDRRQPAAPDSCAREGGERCGAACELTGPASFASTRDSDSLNSSSVPSLRTAKSHAAPFLPEKLASDRSATAVCPRAAARSSRKFSSVTTAIVGRRRPPSRTRTAGGPPRRRRAGAGHRRRPPASKRPPASPREARARPQARHAPHRPRRRVGDRPTGQQPVTTHIGSEAARDDVVQLVAQ